jgi:hypothetical protein
MEGHSDIEAMLLALSIDSMSCAEVVCQRLPTQRASDSQIATGRTCAAPVRPASITAKALILLRHAAPPCRTHHLKVVERRDTVLLGALLVERGAELLAHHRRLALAHNGVEEARVGEVWPAPRRNVRRHGRHRGLPVGGGGGVVGALLRDAPLEQRVHVLVVRHSV